MSCLIPRCPDAPRLRHLPAEGIRRRCWLLTLQIETQDVALMGVAVRGRSVIRVWSGGPTCGKIGADAISRRASLRQSRLSQPDPNAMRNAAQTKKAKFQADSALLRELGERLVGQAHIALAELVKNSYDADAGRCKVSIGSDDIVVEDDGHGMTTREFLNHWMTIGTRHKEDEGRGRSRDLGRNLTGSKGVGRLAAQFLAHELEITTVATGRHRQLVATVNWDDAIDAGRLTNASAQYRVARPSTHFPGGARHGTRVAMTRLKQEWDDTAIRELGRELWMIQSPLARTRPLPAGNSGPEGFEVRLVSELPGTADVFNTQMTAALSNYTALIKGELVRNGGRAHVHVVVTFRSDGKRYSESFEVEPLVDHAKWEIRVFNLAGRQPGGISVKTARDYFERFGGVTVYDARFRLPYYGVEQDWLGIEYDHSHRRNRSVLLPERLQVRRALNDLPTQGRLFGVVDIDTGRESRAANGRQRRSGNYLKIQVTRDRLVSNDAYRALRNAVRWSLDYYATRQRLRENKVLEFSRPTEAPLDAMGRIRKLVQTAQKSHPKDDTVATLEYEIRHLSRAIRGERRAEEAMQALLAPLASAGMAALAMEHESRKELRRGRRLLSHLRRVASDERTVEATDKLQAWLDQVEGSRRLFAPLLDEDDRDEVEALMASEVLARVVEDLRPLIPGMTVDTEVSRTLHLPAGTFAEWSSLFQNVLLNAANATLDATDCHALCVGGRTGRANWIRVHDNGVGVNLDEADELFEPFVRHVEVSDTRRALGLGGMGLGLTIVRTIAHRRSAKVSFVRPPAMWSTTFQMSWRA